MSLHEEKFKVGDLVRCPEEGVEMAIVVESYCRMDGGRRYYCKIFDHDKRHKRLSSDNYHLEAIDLPPDHEHLLRLLYK